MKIVHKFFLEEFLKLKNRFLAKKPNSSEYIAYLNSLPSMNERMSDISIRYRDKKYIHQIKEYFSLILLDPDIQDTDKYTILTFLYEHSFPLFDELIPVLKSLLNSNLIFMTRFMSKLSFTKEEYQNLLKHPNQSVRWSAIVNLKLNVNQSEEILKEFQIFQGIEPIIVIDEYPSSAGFIERDLRFFEILYGYDDARFKKLSSTRKVISLEYTEFMKIRKFIRYSWIDTRNFKPEILQRDAKYFLLVDNRFKDRITLEKIELEDSPSVKDRTNQKNHDKE